MIQAERVRLEWAKWNNHRKPNSYCRGMRYSNTKDLGSSGCTPTILPVTKDFLSGTQYEDRYPVTHLPYQTWDAVSLDFPSHVIVAIAAIDQLKDLLSHGSCLWDRHGRNILVDVQQIQHPWHIDLETVFDMKTEKFRHQDKPYTWREWDHLVSAKAGLVYFGNPVNIQLDIILTALRNRLFSDPRLSDEHKNSNDKIMEKWGSPISERRHSQLQKYQRLLRSFQQRF